MRKVLVITGGSRGIGAATAVLAAGRGYAVCVNYVRNVAAAEGVVRQITETGGAAVAVRADVSREADVVRLFQEADAALGPVTSLVNNAGILEHQARVEAMDEGRLARVFAANVFGSFLCAREAVRRMSTRHGGAGGSIVNVSSAASASGPRTNTSTMRRRRVRSIRSPWALPGRWRRKGYGSTRFGPASSTPKSTQAAVSQTGWTVKGSVPMQRGGNAAEVAGAILWLLSDEASYTSGAILDVSGGR